MAPLRGYAMQVGSDSVKVTAGGRWREWRAAAFTVGGIGTAFAAAACCGLPLILGSVGVSTAWLFGIGEHAAPHRRALLVVSAALLACGAWALWRQRRRACEPGGWCSRPGVRLLVAFGLLAGAALAVLGYRYG